MAAESPGVIAPSATTVFLDNVPEAPNVIVPEAPNVIVPVAPSVIEPEILPAAVVDIPLEPAHPLEPRRRQWARGVARVLVAAAALAVFVGAGVLLAPDDGDVGPDLSEQTTGTTAPEASRRPQSRRPSRLRRRWWSTSSMVGRRRQRRGGAARAAVEEYLIAQSGSAEAFLTEAEEGYGVWAASSDRRVTAIDGLSVVLLEGTSGAEGRASTGWLGDTRRLCGVGGRMVRRCLGLRSGCRGPAPPFAARAHGRVSA